MKNIKKQTLINNYKTKAKQTIITKFLFIFYLFYLFLYA